MPVIETRHLSYPDFFAGDQKYLWRKVRAFYYTYQERKINQNLLSKCIFVSKKAWKNSIEIRIISREKAVHIPNTVDINKFKPVDITPPQKNKVPVLICTGRLDEQKGQHLLIEALRTIKLPWELWLVGTGPQEDFLKELVKKYNLDQKIWFCGYREDIHSFLAKFKLLRRFYSSREAVMRVAYEAVADAAEDNIRYLELRFNPVALSLNQGFSFDDVVDWVILATNQAQADYSIQSRLLVQLGRHEPQYAWQLAEIAAAEQDRGIVALDLAGDEINYPIDKFIDVFQWAKKQGLHITAHAAEAGPPINVKDALEKLGAGLLADLQEFRHRAVWSIHLLQNTWTRQEGR